MSGGDVVAAGTYTRSGERGAPGGHKIIEQTRVCRVCHERKPWSAFHKAQSWPDGSMRSPRSECKACRRSERVDRWQAMDSTDRVRHAIANRRWRRGNDEPGHPGGVATRGEFMPIGPLREWLNKQLDQGTGIEELALWLGIVERKLFRWLHTNDSVPLEDLDRALCHAGQPHLLVLLYPLDEAVAA